MNFHVPLHANTIKNPKILIFGFQNFKILIFKSKMYKNLYLFIKNFRNYLFSYTKIPKIPIFEFHPNPNPNPNPCRSLYFDSKMGIYWQLLLIFTDTDIFILLTLIFSFYWQSTSFFFNITDTDISNLLDFYLLYPTTSTASTFSTHLNVLKYNWRTWYCKICTHEPSLEGLKSDSKTR